MIAEALGRAASRLSRPGCWTQGAEARDAEGNPVHPCDPTAVAWCPNGAVFAEVEDYDSRCRAIRAMQAAVGGPVRKYNDAPGRTAEDVVAVVRRAAEFMR